MMKVKEKTLLLVEDDLAVRDALKNVLAAENFAVHCAASTEQALETYRANQIDVVLLDLNLGEEDGWGTFHALKRLQADLPILVTSAHAHRLQHSSALQASAVLEKPFDPVVLLDLLDKAPAPKPVSRERSNLGRVAAVLLACLLTLLGRAQSAAVPEFRITDLLVRADSVTVFWQGGGATNQLQSRPTLNAPWSDVDVPTSGSSVTHVKTSPNAFYRVVNVQDAFAISADKKAPSTPTGVSTYAASCNQMNLSWTASTDSGQNASGLLGYNVYRNGIFVKQVLAPATSTSDTGLSPWTTYSYSVSAVDRSRNASAKSPAVANTTPACSGTANQAPVANAGADASVTAGASVAVSANGSYDPDGTITSYNWDLGDGNRVTGFSFSHVYSAPGTYLVTLTVTDNNGASASDTRYVFVASASDSTAPTVTLDSPLNGSTLSGTVSLTSSASDNVGVTKVEFYVDSSLLGTDTSYPFAYSWNSTAAADGVHTFVAKAYDAAGNSAFSSVANASVINSTAPGTGSALLQRHFGGIGYGAGAITKQTVVDRAGNVILVGAMYYTVDFGRGPITSAGGQDAFIAKYSPNGQCLWAKLLGNVSSDVAYGVALDSADNILVVGVFSGPMDSGLLDFGTGPQQCKGGSDIFLVKFSGNGDHQWTKLFGGNGADIGMGIAVDSADNILLTGTHGFFGTGADFGGGALTTYGQQDVFVAKLNSAGGYVWARSYGGSESDLATGIAVDSGGNPVVVGNFRGSANFGSGTVTSAGDTDGFVAKYSAANGAVQWSKRLGDSRNQTVNGVAVDAAGNVVITGDFLGTIDFGGSVSVAELGGSFYVAKYSGAGALAWSRSYGAPDNGPHSAGVSVDSAGRIVVVGEIITGIDFGTGWLLGRSNDAFVLKLNTTGSVAWVKRGATASDRATAVAIERSNGNIIMAGDCGTFGVDFGCPNVLSTLGTGNNSFWIEFAP